MPLDLPPLRALVIAEPAPSLDAEHTAVLTWLRDEHGWDLTAGNAADPAWRLTRLAA